MAMGAEDGNWPTIPSRSNEKRRRSSTRTGDAAGLVRTYEQAHPRAKVLPATRALVTEAKSGEPLGK